MYIKRCGFTLIEMLVVVVIIGILAAALIPRLQSAQARARDSVRKVDLQTIATALEIYKADNGAYIPTPGGGRLRSTGTANRATTMILGNIIIKAPIDPVNNDQPSYTNFNYSYAYAAFNAVLTIGTKRYQLFAQLENKNDPDRCAVRQYVALWDNTVWCGSYSAYLYEGGMYKYGR